MSEEPDRILEHVSALRRYALVLCRDAAEAEDLAQEALLRGHEKRRGFRPGGDLKTWLFSILRNAFLDRRRSRAAEMRREAAWAALAPEALESPQEAALRLAQVRAGFLALPEEQREALSLVAIEGLSYAEAAKVAEVPLGTLMSRVSRARAQLRAFEDGRDAPPPQLKLVGGRDADP